MARCHLGEVGRCSEVFLHWKKVNSDTVLGDFVPRGMKILDGPLGIFVPRGTKITNGPPGNFVPWGMKILLCHGIQNHLKSALPVDSSQSVALPSLPLERTYYMCKQYTK